MSINQIVVDFNNTLLTLLVNVANICPNSIVGNNLKEIQREFKKQSNFFKFIDFFCLNILKYKDNFEMFFNTNNNNNTNKIEEILKLKSIWPQLTKENQNNVILYMNILCELSQIYFSCVTSTC